MDEGVRVAVRSGRQRPWRARGVPLLLGLALLLTGCSSGGAGADAGSTGPEAEPLSGASGGEAGGAEDAAQAARAGSTAAGAVAGAASLAPLLAGRDVVVQGTVTVSTEDLPGAARAAADATVRAGGYVEEENRGLPDSGATGDPAEGIRLVLRVPTDEFGRLRDEVAALGDEVSRSTTRDDVTEQVLDVESRLATQRASVERVRALLERATDLSEVVAVEAELTRRQADLESLEARSAALASQVRLATLVVRLLGPGGSLGSGPAPGFLDGLERGWDAFGRALAVAATVTGLLVPFVVAATLLALPVLLLRRRRSPRPGPDTLPVP